MILKFDENTHKLTIIGETLSENKRKIENVAVASSNYEKQIQIFNGKKAYLKQFSFSFLRKNNEN